LMDPQRAIDEDGHGVHGRARRRLPRFRRWSGTCR
jgi:hypothetical protein